MGRNYALNTAQIKRAGELYEAGYSRRQIADYFGCSDSAAAAGVRLSGVRLRDQRYATAMANVQRAQSRRRVASVFELGR